MNKLKLLYLLQIIRFMPSTVAGLAVFVFLLVKGNHTTLLAVIQALLMTIVIIVGYVLNDLYNASKDPLAKTDKPITLGLISKSFVFSFAILLSTVALVVSYYASSIEATYILVFTLVGVSLYSPLAYRMPPFKGFVTPVLYLAPFFYASRITSISIPINMYLATYTFIFGREILLGYKDLKKDLENGLRTLPYYLGKGLSKASSWGLMFIGVLSLQILFSNLIAISLTAFGLIILLMAFYSDRHNEIPDAGLTNWVMVFCLLAIPFNF